MGKGYFDQLTKEEQKQFKQRQVLIEEAIQKGSFRNRQELKAWMKDFFSLKQPVEEISTEHTLTENQKKLFYMWLLYFTGKGKRPHTFKAKALVSDQQLHRINELKRDLGWDSQNVTRFIIRQTGKQKMATSLWKYEATKVITGMERILAEQPFKLKESGITDEQ